MCVLEKRQQHHMAVEEAGQPAWQQPERHILSFKPMGDVMHVLSILYIVSGRHADMSM